ncbi:MAG: PAS domain S-box protein [Bacteroidales bacterium]|nr:PAS domain S-box protein [Bacteroidales bacterium]
MEEKLVLEAFNHLEEAVLILNSECEIEFANRRISDLLEIPVKDLQKRKCEDLIYIERGISNECSFKILENSAKSQDEKLKIRIKNKKFLATVYTTNISGENYIILTFNPLVFEVQTKVKKRESRSVAKEENNIYAYLDILPLPAMITDDQGTIKHINSLWSDDIGYELKDVADKNLSKFIAPGSQIEKLKNPGSSVIEKYGNELVFLKTKSNVIRVFFAHISRVEIKSGISLIWLFRYVSNEEETREEIKQREEYLKSIFRAAPTGIGVLVNRRFYFINKRLCEISGYDAKELLGQSARILYPDEEEYNRVGEVKYEQTRKKGTGTIETKWKCKNGDIKEILLSSTPIDTSNYSKGVTFTALDITRRKQAEEKYLKSAEQYKKLIESAADAIIIADAKTGKIIEVNKKACELTGYSYSEIEGMHYSMLHPPEIREASLKGFSEVVKGNLKISQSEILHKSGEKIPVEINPSSYKNNDGEELIIGFFRNLSQRIRWQIALEESEMRYKLLFESVKDGIIIIDPEIKQFEYVNPAVCHFLGYTEQELLKKTTQDIHPADEFSSIQKKMNKVINGQVSTARDIPCITKEGNRVYANISANYISFKEKTYLVSFFSDVTEQVETHLMLKESEERYKSLVEISPNMIFVINKMGFIYVNPTALHNLGYNFFEELKQFYPLDIVTPKFRDEVEEKISRLIDYGEQSLIEIQLLRQDKALIYVQCTLILITYEKQKAVLISATDITEKKFAEKFAKETEKTIQDIQAGLASKLGEKFFETIIVQLTRTLNAQYAFIGEIDSENQQIINIISICKHGKILNNFSYCSTDSPSGKVIESGVYLLEKGICSTFPHDKFFTENKIEGYIGVSLRDSSGEKVGLLVAMYDKPIMNPERAKSILEIFSARAGAEIERRKSQKELEKFNELFRTITENLPDIILRVDKNLRCIYASKNIIEYAGIEADDFIGKRITEVDLETDFSENREKDFQEVFNTKEARQTIITVNTEKGRRILEWRLIPEFDEKGNVGSLLNLIRDITELRHTEEQFNKMFDLSTDLISIVNKKGKFIQINPAFESILGYTQQELIGSSVIDLVNPDDKKKTQELMMVKVVKDQGVVRFENRFRCKDGSYKWLSWSSQPLFEKDLVFAIARDVTEQRKAMQELVKAKEKAEESDRLKSTFLANMSHEIRTPMNAIIGFSNLLQRDNLPHEKRMYYTRVIQNRSDDLLHIINDILDISKIESGQIKITKREFSAREMLKEIHDEFQQKITTDRKNKIQLKIDNSLTKESDILYNDSLRIKQVLTNLIDNAIKFTEKGEVKFGCTGIAGEVVFNVSDTGIGIPVHKREKIFERFRQAEESITRRYGGNGLGLAISKALVNMMGGRIWLESVEDQGTDFYFTIPADKPRETKFKVEKEKIGLNIDFSDKKILVVEDDLLSAEFLRILLEGVNAEVTFAYSGGEALILFENKKRFDIILMDIQLPDISGYEVTRRIRKHDTRVPIIAQTAFAMSEDRQKSMEAGCDAYLSKPISSDDLLQIIGKMLNGSNGSQVRDT